MGDGATGYGPVGNEAQDTKVSAAQVTRVVAQAMAVVDLLEEVRLRDLLIAENIRIALAALSRAGEAAEIVAKKALDDTSLVRLTNSLLLLAEKVSEKMDKRYASSKFLSWTRQFRHLGGYLSEIIEGCARGSGF